MHDFTRKTFSSSAQLIKIILNMTVQRTYNPILINKLICGSYMKKSPTTASVA